MKIIKFTNIQYGEIADLVVCNYCNSDAMLVPCGTDICPLCGVSGCLEWEQSYHNDNLGATEVKVAEIENKNEIILMDAKHVELFDE